MSELARLLNLAARLYACGHGETLVVLRAGTVRIPLRLIGFDADRDELMLELNGDREEESS